VLISYEGYVRRLFRLTEYSVELFPISPMNQLSRTGQAIAVTTPTVEMVAIVATP